MASMHLTHALQFLCLFPGVLSYVFYVYGNHGLCVVLYVTVLCPRVYHHMVLGKSINISQYIP